MFDFIAARNDVAPVPEWIARLLEIVRRDLEPDGGLATAYALATDRPAHLWAWVPGGHSASGFGVVLDGPDSEAAWIVALADWMQGTFFSVEDSFATTQPACGEHPHSMEATLIEDEAWWVCRYSARTPIRRIGDAATASR